MASPKYYASVPVTFDEAKKWTDQIKPEDLDSQPGKNPIETRHHVTLHVMLPNRPSDALVKQIAAYAPFRIELDQVGVFENKTNDVLHVKVLVNKQLKQLHELLIHEYKIPWNHPTYTPHLTLAFLKPGQGKHYTTLFTPRAVEMMAKTVEFRQHAALSKDGNDVLVVSLDGTDAPGNSLPQTTQ